MGQRGQHHPRLDGRLPLDRSENSATGPLPERCSMRPWLHRFAGSRWRGRWHGPPKRRDDQQQAWLNMLGGATISDLPAIRRIVAEAFRLGSDDGMDLSATRRPGWIRWLPGSGSSSRVILLVVGSMSSRSKRDPGCGDVADARRRSRVSGDTRRYRACWRHWSVGPEPRR